MRRFLALAVALALPLVAEAAPHRYWRIYVTQSGGNYVDLDEVELRATSTGADQCVGGTVSASGTYSTSTPDKALKGVTGPWVSASGLPQWWKYDFGTPVYVRTLLITSFSITSEFPRSFALQWSDDDSAWTAAATFADVAWSTHQTQVFTIAPDPVSFAVSHGYARRAGHVIPIGFVR